MSLREGNLINWLLDGQDLHTTLFVEGDSMPVRIRVNERERNSLQDAVGRIENKLDE